jgi:DNA-binding transcriptional LysR family regulator
MHIETLKVFCDVVETGSFSVAASQNFITQSAVSQQLRALEAKYRCKLLERSRGGAKPTPQGAILYRTSREIIDKSDICALRSSTASGCMSCRPI